MLEHLSSQTLTIFGIAFATTGWVWSTKRARSLSRKQHTFNALLQSRFNAQYQEAHGVMRHHIKSGKKVELSKIKNKEFDGKLTFILNHYEFLSAGVRNGDISEQLLKDSQRSVIVSLFEFAEPYIQNLRNDRHKQALFEHLEWLYMRWKGAPPDFVQKVCELLISRPIYHSYYKWFFWAPVLFLIGMAAEGIILTRWWHTPPP
jgi:hypothetical protein